MLRIAITKSLFCHCSFDIKFSIIWAVSCSAISVIIWKGNTLNVLVQRITFCRFFKQIRCKLMNVRKTNLRIVLLFVLYPSSKKKTTSNKAITRIIILLVTYGLRKTPRKPKCLKNKEKTELFRNLSDTCLSTRFARLSNSRSSYYSYEGTKALCPEET